MYYITLLTFLTLPSTDNRLPSPQSLVAEQGSPEVLPTYTVPQAPRAHRVTVPKYGPAGQAPKSPLQSPRSLGEATPHSGFQLREIPTAAVGLVRGLFAGPKMIRLCPRH